MEWRGGLFWLACGAWALASGARAAELEIPKNLPRYDLDLRIDTTAHVVQVRERVTWTNRRQRPTRELVFNVYPHFQLPEKDLAVVAKTIELLRQEPRKVLDPAGRSGDVRSIVFLGRTRDGVRPASEAGPATPPKLASYYQAERDTTLVVPLPEEVGPGESVAVELEYTLILPNKQGRWGYQDSITSLNQFLPTLAYYDESGWQPTAFIPWHQPFYCEAGIYTARIQIPAAEKLACSAPIRAVRDLGAGWSEIMTESCPLRDFTLVSSARFREFTREVEGVVLRSVTLPEHEFYAEEMLRIVAEALPAYNRWFGKYPYRHFTVVEGCFPWNGNESSALVMIDSRVLQMPHLAREYVDYLVSHEFMHQWWYNAVGTNGYRETFMDEGVVTHFSHKWINEKHGRNNPLLEWPKGLTWLPNIHRENYRFSARLGAIRRGDRVPAVVPAMEDFGSVVGLFSGAYDRGSKVVGMIEERLGEAATFDFFRGLYRKYYFDVLRVADFQRELEEYSGRSWDDFFKNWVYGKGVNDWKVETVALERLAAPQDPAPEILRPAGWTDRPPVDPAPGRHRATVLLKQQGDFFDQTTLGFQLGSSTHYPVRVPIYPQLQVMTLEDPPTRIETLPDKRIRVTVDLPEAPTQVAVDPDQVMEDAEPANNFWKARERWRWTPIYTQLEEADLMNDYDRWNFLCGPWVHISAARDPWFQRPSYGGVRFGAYSTQQFSGGAYAALRSDYRDVVVGLDGLIDHWPGERTQLGYIIERRVVAPFGSDGPENVLRAAVFGRYVFQYTSALYLNPMKYADVFATYQDNPLPYARTLTPGAVRPDRMVAGGLHYQVNYLTPYWNPEAGYFFDIAYAGGMVDMEAQGQSPLHKMESQLTVVKSLPSSWGWLGETRLAARGLVAGAVPDEGLHFAMGGATVFRGYDLAQRQGSMMWVGNLEWRVPIVQDLNWDCCDHILGLRGLWFVPFYDVGAIYVNGQTVGGDVAHALGASLRFDLAWFSFIERSIVRIDAAKTVNDSTPWQFWLGVQHAF